MGHGKNDRFSPVRDGGSRVKKLKVQLKVLYTYYGYNNRKKCARKKWST
jgi:hypothetical protein